MRILNLERIVFLMCIVSSWEITWGTGNDKTAWKEKITVEKLGSGSEKEINLEYKVVFLGDTQVGKTQIINRHVTEFFEGKCIPTIGIVPKNQGYKSTINEDNSQTIQLNILDTAGQERFRSVLPGYVNNARAIVLVYDVTQKVSFNNIKNNWLSWAKEKAHKDAVYFLVGNKTDLGNTRQIQTAVAEQYAKNNNMQFFEVSAMNSNRIDELFKDIVKELLIKEEDIINAIKEDEKKNNTNNDSGPNVNKKETNLTTQDKTHTKNKRCSCCPCNKEKEKCTDVS